MENLKNDNRNGNSKENYAYSMFLYMLLLLLMVSDAAVWVTPGPVIASCEYTAIDSPGPSWYAWILPPGALTAYCDTPRSQLSRRHKEDAVKGTVQELVVIQS